MELNESTTKEILSCFGEAVADQPRGGKRPRDANRWTFADWFGKDLTGQTYDGSLDCSGCGLTSLEGVPDEVNGSFNCSDNDLRFLKGSPRTVSGDFRCSGNRLRSLEGCPNSVGGDFECERNRLDSVMGLPGNVGGRFICNDRSCLKFRELVYANADKLPDYLWGGADPEE